MAMEKVEWMKGGDAERVRWQGGELYRERNGRDEVKEGKMSQLIYLPVSMATGGLSRPLSPFSLFRSNPSPLAPALSFPRNTFTYTTSVHTCLDV